ncbi:sensor domain-containing diguanylate cyclase [Desulforamulus ruminis]|uniref:Diguanylate cyclase n=1 Tax=Desulforamulus ruminis (strain ATCC 23193 / DSM 2154 / NCIMB 8452 / DL) TaxID=696281 RepID=F6DKE8_DESRL|nr:GGDEF domain-containing protein [Desulforamulus ruminis]AEG61565.1 diguanylate cyclase [Desulforamulus ruminis DSM 2154]
MLNNFILGKRIRTSLLTGFVVFIILPALLVGLFTLLQSHRIMEKSVHNTLDYLADTQQNAMSNWLDGRKVFIEGLAQNEQIKIMEPEAATRVITETLPLDHSFRSLVLVGTDGWVKSGRKNNTIWVGDREYFKQAMVGKTFVSEVLISRSNNDPVITVATPVKNQGKIVGVLFGGVDIKVITKMVQQNFPGTGGESYLINSDGLMISESQFTPELIAKQLVESKSSMNLKLNTQASQMISRGMNGSGIYTNYLDQRVFGLYRWLPDIKMGLIVEKQYHTAMLEAGLNTYYSVILTSGLAMLFFIFFAVYYSHRLSQPLERLAQEVNNIGQEDFRSVINVGANKEVEELVEAINRMSTNLFHSTSQLNSLIEKLEQSQAELNQEKSKLAQISITDELTGLYNRRQLNDEMERLVSLAISLGKNISFMMLDLDRFKRVNDTYGHATGDVVLKEFAVILRELCRATDVVGRFGGEEFVILVPFVKSDVVMAIAERIRAEVENFIFDADHHRIKITVSIGIAAVEAVPGTSVKRTSEELIMAADKCLYKAKNSGRNKTVLELIEIDTEQPPS